MTDPIPGANGVWACQECCFLVLHSKRHYFSLPLFCPGCNKETTWNYFPSLKAINKRFPCISAATTPMTDSVRSAILAPEQIAAMAAGFGRIGTAAQLVAARLVEGFEAALPARPWARPLEVAQRGPTIGRKHDV
jgi:hypothetical protein